MKHRKKGNQLGRNAAHRLAMTRNLVTSLFQHGRVETTLTRAKGVRPVAEKLVTLAKRGDLHARRQAARYIQNKNVLRGLFDYWAGIYADRPGGYTRILKSDFRHGDGAETAYLELIGPDGGAAPPPHGEAIATE
ncbi:MAG: 50S ribosomal protein L17 [Gemmatimonadetes bacterium]|nr:50S ribosomal protein L17 [Gemmatimonadota bacterium]